MFSPAEFVQIYNLPMKKNTKDNVQIILLSHQN